MKALFIQGVGVTQNLRRSEALIAGVQSAGYDVQTVYGDCADLPRMNPKADIVLCSGLKDNTKIARCAASKLGVPCLVVELGYLKRAHSNGDLDGYFQLGWDRLCWVPDNVPPDRWERLELKLEPTHKPGDYILVAAQVGNDAQHNLTSRQLCTWLTKEARALEKKLRKPAVWRPHPAQRHWRPDTWNPRLIQNPSAVSLGKALEHAHTVLTYNSTLGVDAMLKAVPVYSHGTAHYASHAVEDYGTRLKYLTRLAYAQWTLEELASGEAVQFALNRKPG
jgi:capsule polysaccharide export protein KpsC/LpsZ